MKTAESYRGFFGWMRHAACARGQWGARRHQPQRPAGQRSRYRSRRTARAVPRRGSMWMSPASAPMGLQHWSVCIPYS